MKYPPFMEEKQMSREKERLETAIYRLNTFVAPLLSCDKATRCVLEEVLAKKYELSRRTVHRYYMAYMGGGLEALMPKAQERIGSRVIPDKVIKEAISMKEVVPTRSLSDIIFTLETEGVIETKGSVKRSTLQNNLQQLGYARRQIQDRTFMSEEAVLRFQKTHRMDLVQCDIKEGSEVLVDGKLHKVYWISWIDDHSRYLLGGRFFLHQSELDVIESFREMITLYGKPKKIYSDNGGAYISGLLSEVCANLGIKHSRHLPRNCQAKGKQERVNGTLDSFVNECFNSRDFTLAKMNAYFKAWEDVGYLDYPHEGLDGKTPRSVFNSDPTPLRLVSKEELDKAFIRTVERKVSKSCTISYKSKTYQISDLNMRGLYVTIKVQPLTGEILSVTRPGFQDATAKLVVIGENIDFEAKAKAKKANREAREKKAREKKSRVLEAYRKAFEEKYPDSTLFDGIDDVKDVISKVEEVDMPTVSRINFNAFVDKEDKDNE